jgi:hypothetical protein
LLQTHTDTDTASDDDRQKGAHAVLHGRSPVAMEMEAACGVRMHAVKPQ